MDPQEVASAVRAARRSSGRRTTGNPGGVAQAAGPGQSRESGGGPESIPPGGGSFASADTAAPTIGIAQLPHDPVTRLERELLMALLQHPGDVPLETAQRALATSFSQPTLATVRDALLAAIEAYGTPDWARKVAEEAPPAFSPLVTQLAIAPLPIREGHAKEYCRGITSSLIDRDLLRRKTELLGALQRTDAASEPERYRALQEQLVQLEGERRRVRGD